MRADPKARATGSRPYSPTQTTELVYLRQLIVAGYSLPETDTFFRYLFAFGLDGPTFLRRIVVFGPDRDEKVEQRFSDFLARGIAHRFSFERVLCENAMDRIAELLNEE